MPDKPKHAGRFRQRNKVASLAAAERRVQVAQMTKEGETAWEIAQKLGVSTKTIERDQEFLMDYVNERARPDVEEMQRRADQRLTDLDMDLESALLNGTIAPDKRISLALDILDARRKLHGLDAPSRSESRNLNVNIDEVDPATLPEYRRWLYETRFMDAATKEKAFQLIRGSGLNRREPLTIEPPDSSPLWNTPKLTEGGNETS